MDFNEVQIYAVEWSTASLFTSVEGEDRSNFIVGWMTYLCRCQFIV